ncbi:YqzE family protein [Brevibacillus sp. B_LB10_24]|uniref:YqzE family protein n=1 Tax=Brevibacillus sp. B_LB10_24 TaxID=3380645 RepID=UPI0038BD98FA
MSFQEYLKYLTKRLVEYLDTPAVERKRRKEPREAWSTRWFGAIPMSIRLLRRK